MEAVIKSIKPNQHQASASKIEAQVSNTKPKPRYSRPELLEWFYSLESYQNTIHDI